MSYYYYLKAPRPMSNGKLATGVAYGGQMVFENGLTGPHTKQEVDRIQAVVGGFIVSREYGDAYLKAIEDGVPAEDLFFDRVDPLNTELAPAASEVNPPSYDDVGYHDAVKTMAKAGFDWKAVTSGSRKADDVRSAWEAFLES